MKIALLGGKQSENYKQKIEAKLSAEIDIYSNIQEDLRTLSVKTDYDTIVLFDESFISEKGIISSDKVFQIINLFATSHSEIDYMFITKLPDFYTKCDDIFAGQSNVYCTLLEEITSEELYNIILKKDTITAEDKKEEETIVTEEIEGLDDGSDDEIKEVPINETVKELEPVKEPEPVVEPTPEPITKSKPKKVPKQKPVKEKKGFSLFTPKKKLNLSDYQLKNKILIITGNPSSGVTSTCSGILKVLSEDMINTLAIDLDLWNKGLSLYNDMLETNMTSSEQKSGLYTYLTKQQIKQEFYLEYYPLIKLLSNDKDIPTNDIITALIRKKINIKALLTLLTLEADLIVLHIPIDLLIKCSDIIETATNILYCTEPTINGIANINKYLGFNGDNDDEKIVKINMHKKTKFLLCNVTQNTDINLEDFTNWIVEYTNVKSLNQETINKIPHLEGFDDFGDVKANITEIKGIPDILRQTVIDLIK